MVTRGAPLVSSLKWLVMAYLVPIIVVDLAMLHRLNNLLEIPQRTSLI